MRIDKFELQDVRAWAERTSGEVVDSARKLHLARILEALTDLEYIEAAEDAAALPEGITADGVLPPADEPPERIEWIEPELSAPPAEERRPWWKLRRG